MSIQNYGELKTAVQDYINRDTPEIINRIPTFIQLAERKIFRRLRCPANEDTREWPEGTEGVDDYSSLTLPTDYLEAKLLVMNDIPLTRVSELELQNQLKTAPEQGTPMLFARFERQLKIWRPPDFPYLTRLIYWKDFSGQLIEDTDTTDFLRLIPDMYLYGACLEAQPWLKKDERITTWAALWNDALEAVNWQRDEAEYSGSPVSVSSAYESRSGMSGRYG